MEAKPVWCPHHFYGWSIYSLQSDTSIGNETVLYHLSLWAKSRSRQKTTLGSLNSTSERYGRGLVYPWGFQLSPPPRRQNGGTNIQAAGIKPFEDCINTCEVQQMRSTCAYFTWTNKIIWIRIDRALVNTLWYDPFDFSQVIYMANSLSNHTALIIDTPSCP